MVKKEEKTECPGRMHLDIPAVLTQGGVRGVCGQGRKLGGGKVTESVGKSVAFRVALF